LAVVKPVTAVGRWSTRHPWLAIGSWLAFVVLTVGLLAATGTRTLQNGAVGESARGYDLLDANRLWAPPHEVAYLHSATDTVRDPAFRATIRDVARRVQGDGDVLTPFDSGGRALVARDGHSALVVVTLGDVRASDVRARVLAAQPAHPTVTIEETGDITASDAVDNLTNDDLQRAEILSVPVTLLVLLFAFGAIVAASVPVLLALTAVVAAYALQGPVSQLFAIDDSVRIVLVLIGMAVGVDYALFYIIRSREERRKGLQSHDALERTARTSGRTVIVSGTTVVIAMAALFLVRAKTFDSLAAATIAVVACAVVGSITVLPAVLELLGSRIDKGRLRFLPHLRTDDTHSRFWPAVVNGVLRRPALWCALSAGLLVALCVPALWLHVSSPADTALAPQSIPALRAFADVRRDFPGASEPAAVVATVPAGQAAALRTEAARLQRLAFARGVAHPPAQATSSVDGTAGALFLPLSGTGDNGSSRQAVTILRKELVPETIGRIPGARVAVTGSVAEDVDFTRQIDRGLPYVLAFVLLLAFVVLLVAFRSLVVPVKAIVLNLLSVGAAYGLLVLVFEHTWAEPILGFESNGAIISWLPLFLFVVLFGLSMDYHVFILSRVRENVDAGMNNDDAVREGLVSTAGVVTSAALVMFAVFAIFGSLSSLDVKEAGVGLAAAVVIDATIVRAVLLPSSMKLLGDWNWYLPRAFRRLL
jgi:RND superfamily putative drug exporter